MATEKVSEQAAASISSIDTNNNNNQQVKLQSQPDVTFLQYGNTLVLKLSLSTERKCPEREKTVCKICYNDVSYFEYGRKISISTLFQLTSHTLVLAT